MGRQCPIDGMSPINDWLTCADGDAEEADACNPSNGEDV